MADTENALKELDEARKKYEAAEQALATARAFVTEKVVAALKAKAAPTEVARRSPFSDTYVRTLAREAGVPPAKPGIKPGMGRNPKAGE